MAFTYYFTSSYSHYNTSRAGCIPVCTQQLPCIGCVSFYRNADVQGVSLSTANSLHVQGVSLSTANSLHVQGVSLSTANSLHVQGVSLSSACYKVMHQCVYPSPAY
jgi:hypothetical protein